MYKLTGKIDGAEYPLLIIPPKGGVPWCLALEESGEVFAHIYVPGHITDEPSIVAWAATQLDKIKATYTYGRLSRNLDFKLFHYRKRVAKCPGK